MINISVLDFGSLENFKAEIPLHQSEIRKRIDGSKNEKLRAIRRISYSLLLCSYIDFYGKEAPKVVFSGLGKPSFAEGDVGLSVSHTDGFCAVAFAKKEVGIDVETIENLDKNSRQIKRFVNESVKNALNSAEKASVTVKTYVLKDGEINLSQDALGQSVLQGDEHLWCALEAVLKCKEGFESYPVLSEISKGVRLYTFSVKDTAVISAAYIR